MVRRFHETRQKIKKSMILLEAVEQNEPKDERMNLAPRFQSKNTYRKQKVTDLATAFKTKKNLISIL
jgi:hypothetical protein